MKGVNRRSFFRSVAGYTGVAGAFALLANSFAWAKDKVYKKSELATTKKNPSVKALKYVDNATSPEGVKYRKAAKQGVPAEKQFCDNCNFYKEPGKLEGSNEGVGKCLMLANQVVYGKGWCNVWSKKA